MDESLKKSSSHYSPHAHEILCKAYSEIVSHSIMALVVYEEYLLGKTSSQELAQAMSHLREALPTSNRKHKKHAKFVQKLKKTNNRPTIASKRFPLHKGG